MFAGSAVALFFLALHRWFGFPCTKGLTLKQEALSVLVVVLAIYPPDFCVALEKRER